MNVVNSSGSKSSAMIESKDSRGYFKYVHFCEVNYEIDNDTIIRDQSWCNLCNMLKINCSGLNFLSLHLNITLWMTNDKTKLLITQISNFNVPSPS